MVRFRKGFLLLCIAGLFSFSACDQPEPIPTLEGVDQVIVIGACMSGLSAARILHDSGIEVSVLEAADRIGGRTHTITLEEGALDLGGAWIHGTRRNPLVKLMKGYGLTYRKHGYDLDVIKSESGQKISYLKMLQVFEKAYRFYNELEDHVEDPIYTVSAKDALESWLDQKDWEPRMKSRVRFALEAEIELGYAGPIDKASAGMLIMYNELSGGDHLPEGGYGALIQNLAKDLDIQLNSSVTHIDYTDTQVSVKTQSGKTYTASHVIVTVPLGVLKSGAIQFTPPLPEEKQQSIKNLDMGNLEKVVLQFDTVFWEAFKDQAGLLQAEEPGYFPFFVDFTPYVNQPTLVGLYGGRFSRQVQADWADEKIQEEACKALARITETEVSEPVNVEITHWTNNPWSYGSYSYLAIGATPDDFDILAQPVADRVLFAGEATHRDYSATVHGALLTGIREAERLGGDVQVLPGW